MGRDRGNVWACDTEVSQPEPIDEAHPLLANFGGIGMTEGGLAHGVTAADLEAIFTPRYAPEDFRG